MLLTPRWYQTEARQSIFDYFEGGKSGNPVVALPTGTGKSIVIGDFSREVLWRYPRQRIIMATHVKELIEQNAEKLNQIWPHAPYGLHSAGLKARDVMQPIIYGGIASMYEAVETFGHRDLLLIDEAHLVNPKVGTMYMSFIEGLKKTNPWLKTIGFTATNYRQGMGYITDDGLFTDVCYDMTDIDGFARLIAEGYLAPLIPRPTNVALDTAGVGMSSSTGDFNLNALQAAVDKSDVTYAALQETLRYGSHCQSWLVFASGIEHAEHIAAMLNQFGVPAAAVHSKLPGKDKQRDEIYKAFKEGKLRALVGNNMFTTGFDHPPVDLIVMLRPTMSTSLWVQMLGRGTRPFGGDMIFRPKSSCLVLDFARNTIRLGPINDPVIPRKKGKGTGDAPVKICDACGTYNHASARFCIGCGEEFHFETKIIREASTAELLRSTLPEVQTFNVQYVTYNKYITKANKIPSLKVTYLVHGSIRPFQEFVNLEHNGSAAHFAHEWWRTRHNTEPPGKVDDALNIVQHLRVPARIRVWTNKVPHPEILGYEYNV